MKKGFFVCAILFLFVESYAQHTVVVDKALSPAVQQLLPDSILQPKSKVLESRRIAKKETGQLQKIYSEKQWKSYADSLSKMPSVHIPQLSDPGWHKKEVAKEALLQQVKQDFFQTSRADSLKRAAQPPSLSPLADKATLPVADLPSPGLSQLKLPQESLGGLSPLSGNQVKSVYLAQFDSLQRAALREGKLKLEEKKVSPEHTLSNFVPKPSLKERLYFEGVVGVSGNNLRSFQVSPALGYHFMNDVSVGIGPTLFVRNDTKTVNATAGIRAFLKMEFLQRRAYLQVEDMMGGYYRSETREQKMLDQQTIMAGGGYLFSVSSKFSLNLMALYTIRSNQPHTHEFSPLVLRLGISSIKTGNK